VRTRVRINVPKFLQGRMQVATDDVGRREWFPGFCLEQETTGARVDELP